MTSQTSMWNLGEVRCRSRTRPAPGRARHAPEIGSLERSRNSDLVGERSRNSDLGGRAKSEFRPRSHWQKSALQSSYGRTFLGRIPISGGAGLAGWCACRYIARLPGHELRENNNVHSFIYPSPGQQDTPLENFGTNRQTFRHKIAENCSGSWEASMHTRAHFA